MKKKRTSNLKNFLLPGGAIVVSLLIFGSFSGLIFKKEIVKYSADGDVREIDLILNKNKFGNNENLKGSLKIEHTGELSLDDKLSFDILGCGNYNEKEFSLFHFLNSTGDYDLELSNFVREDSSTQFDASNGNLIGFYFEGNSNDIKFDLTGNANFLRLDLNADGDTDWAFSGERTGWGSEISSELENECEDLSSSTDYNPHSSRSQYLTFNYTGAGNEIDLKVNVVAKTIGNNSDNLTIKVNNKTCSLNGVTDSYQTISNCEFKIPVEDGENNIQVKFITASNNYRVPKCVGEDYYFVTGNLGQYNTQILPGTNYVINSTSLAQSINSNKLCDDGACLTVAKVITNSEGNLKFGNLILTTSSGTINGFWSVEEEVNSVNISDKNLSIENLNLKAPSTGDDCELKVEFGGESDEFIFDVVQSPNAVISLDSEFGSTGQPIDFSGAKSTAPSPRTITGYKWNFGDNTTGNGQNLTHTYSKQGTYKTILEITDSLGIKDTDEREIIIGDLESYLDSLIDETLEDISNSDLNVVGTESGRVLDALRLRDNLDNYETQIEKLKINFTDARNNNQTSKYPQFASQLKSIRDNYPVYASVSSKIGTKGFFMESYNDIFEYKTSEIINLQEYKIKIYDYNFNQVDFDNKYALVSVNFLDGEKTYLLVEKKINAPSASNRYVEDISAFSGKNITKITDFTVDGDYLTKDFTSVLDIKYVVETNSLQETNAVVYKDVELSEPIWQENCVSGSCDYAYCGDKVCNKGYETESSCEVDCKVQRPIWMFYVLGGVLLIGIIYIWLYRGPGNFRDISNAMSVAVTGKRIFTNQQDLIKLESYVSEMLKRGFTERQLTLALKQKGWTSSQVDYIFKTLKGKT